MTTVPLKRLEVYKNGPNIGPIFPETTHSQGHFDAKMKNSDGKILNKMTLKILVYHTHETWI